MKRILFLFAVIFLAGLFMGCQKPIVYAAPILPEPDQPISPFVQEVNSWICAPATTGTCTQQVFSWVVPNVRNGDTLKVVFWWFAGQTLTPSQVPVATDSASSVYSLIQFQADGSGQKYGYIFSTSNVNSNGNDVTVRVVLPFSTGNAVDLDALEYSAGASVDGATGANGFGQPLIQTGSMPVSTDSDVLLSIYFGSTIPVYPCSVCNVRYHSSHTNFIVQDFFPPAPGSYQASFLTQSTFGAWGVSAASFK
jgi:hypothetical protein